MKGQDRREERITFRVSKATKAYLEDQAKLDGRSVADFVVRVLETRPEAPGSKPLRAYVEDVTPRGKAASKKRGNR